MPSVHAIFPVDGIKIMCKNGSRHCGVLAGAAPASRSAGATVLLTPKGERRTERSWNNLLPYSVPRLKMYTSFLLVVSVAKGNWEGGIRKMESSDKEYRINIYMQAYAKA